MNSSFSIESKVRAFSQLGRVMAAVASATTNGVDAAHYALLKEAVVLSSQHNAWFTGAMIHRALSALAGMLDPENLRKWRNQYPLELVSKPRRVLVVSAGNIPAVGFHDWMCVLMSGHDYIGKLSGDDRFLIPAMERVLTSIEPAFELRSVFTDQPVKEFGAVIATGSGNTSRYFEYYFSKWPHLIRANRTGVAILSGRESRHELKAVVDDLILYYGLGCRNVSACYIPQGFDVVALCDVLATRNEELMQNHKWMNNYDYQKALMLINREPFFDTGALLLRHHTDLNTPVAVVNLITYSDAGFLEAALVEKGAGIQCVVSSGGWFPASFSFGKSQQPSLSDYADGVDTMNFLTSLG